MKHNWLNIEIFYSDARTTLNMSQKYSPFPYFGFTKQYLGGINLKYLIYNIQTPTLHIINPKITFSYIFKSNF